MTPPPSVSLVPSAALRSLTPAPVAPGPHCRPTEPFPEREYLARIRLFKRDLKAGGFDAALVTGETHRTYLSGFPASNGILIIEPGGRPIFHTDFRYLEAARAALPFADVRKMPATSGRLGPASRRGRWRAVGHEDNGLPGARLAAYRAMIPRVTDWKPVGGVLLDRRAVKRPLELTAIRAAVEANDEAYARTLAVLGEGMTEWEIRRAVRRHLDDLSQGEAFDTIAAVGANTSKCHHHPGLDRVAAGRPLLIDMGAVVQGYRSDMTRTVFIGPPSAILRRVYATVLRAQLAAIRAIRPGRSCADIDAVARRIIARAGYARYFGHGLGHGVGLDIHERPSLNAANKTTKLVPGMVVTVEPGVYLPRIGGVRIEDIVVVTKSGCDVLTKTPKRLMILGGADA